MQGPADSPLSENAAAVACLPAAAALRLPRSLVKDCQVTMSSAPLSSACPA